MSWYFNVQEWIALKYITYLVLQIDPLDLMYAALKSSKHAKSIAYSDTLEFEGQTYTSIVFNYTHSSINITNNHGLTTQEMSHTL